MNNTVIQDGMNITPKGHKYWYRGGVIHRDEGPAVEYNNGTKYWYQNGEVHRLDGPAIVYRTGRVEFFIEGEFYTESNFRAKVLEIGLEKVGL